jgi:hypothetical protein
MLGEKVWEIRSQDTKFRGEIGLGYRGHRYGTSLLVDVKRMSLEELNNILINKVPLQDLKKYLHGKNFGYTTCIRTT